MHVQCKYKPVVADLGGAGGPGGPGHPLFSDQTKARRTEKKLSEGLNDRSPPPPLTLSQGLDGHWPVLY